MACCNVWGTKRFNNRATYFNILQQIFTLYTVILILETSETTIRLIFLQKMQMVLQSPQSKLWYLSSNGKYHRENGKYHFVISTSEKLSLNVTNFEIKNSDFEKLLSAKFDSKLHFVGISKICVKQLAGKYTHLWRDISEKINTFYGHHQCCFCRHEYFFVQHQHYFVDRKHFFVQYQLVIVDTRLLFLQTSFFDLKLFFVQIQIFILDYSNKNIITCQKRNMKFHFYMMQKK